MAMVTSWGAACLDGGGPSVPAGKLAGASEEARREGVIGNLRHVSLRPLRGKKMRYAAARVNTRRWDCEHHGSARQWR